MIPHSPSTENKTLINLSGGIKKRPDRLVVDRLPENPMHRPPRRCKTLGARTGFVRSIRYVQSRISAVIGDVCDYIMFCLES